MPKEDWALNSIDKIFKKVGLWPWEESEIETILDVGCGLSLKSKFIPAKIRVGVDIYEEYFKHIESDVPYVAIKYDARKLKDIFIPKGFDLVIGSEIIEHLEKDEGLDLLDQMETIAKKGVAIDVPKGFHPQDIDILGHGGHHWQTHRSAWEPEEFEKRGYKTILRDYTTSDAKRCSTQPGEKMNVVIIHAIKIFKI